MTPMALVLVQLIVTCGMTAVIWFVQVAHYPLHLLVPESVFLQYQKSHLLRVTFIVGPLMLVESVVASWLLFLSLPDLLGVLAWSGFVLLLLLWISTACLQVPCHRILEHEHDPDTIRRLVATNWVRTILWSARSVIAVVMMVMVVCDSSV